MITFLNGFAKDIGANVKGAGRTCTTNKTKPATKLNIIIWIYWG